MSQTGTAAVELKEMAKLEACWVVPLEVAMVALQVVWTVDVRVASEVDTEAVRWAAASVVEQEVRQVADMAELMAAMLEVVMEAAVHVEGTRVVWVVEVVEMAATEAHSRRRSLGAPTRLFGSMPPARRGSALAAASRCATRM